MHDSDLESRRLCDDDQSTAPHIKTTTCTDGVVSGRSQHPHSTVSLPKRVRHACCCCVLLGGSMRFVTRSLWPLFFHGPRLTPGPWTFFVGSLQGALASSVLHVKTGTCSDDVISHRSHHLHMTVDQDHSFIVKANILEQHVKCPGLTGTRQDMKFLIAEEPSPQRRPMAESRETSNLRSLWIEMSRAAGAEGFFELSLYVQRRDCR